MFCVAIARDISKAFAAALMVQQFLQKRVSTSNDPWFARNNDLTFKEYIFVLVINTNVQWIPLTNRVNHSSKPIDVSMNPFNLPSQSIVYVIIADGVGVSLNNCKHLRQPPYCIHCYFGRTFCWGSCISNYPHIPEANKRITSLTFLVKNMILC